MDFQSKKVFTATITSNAFGGYGIAEIQTDKGVFKIMVENAIEGQTVEFFIKKRKKNYAIARINKIISPSPLEIKTKFQSISGAPFISLPIKYQHEIKKRETLNIFKKIAKISDIENYFDEFITPPKEYNYRNKMEYTFSSTKFDFKNNCEVDNVFALGFKKRGTWWCVENLDKESGLFDKTFEDQLYLIRDYCQKTKLPAWNPFKKEGFFRFLVVKKSFFQDKLLIKLITSSKNEEDFEVNKFSELILKLFPNRIAGIIHSINDNIGDNTIANTGKEKLIYGNNIITEKLLNLKFNIGVNSFFQTNPLAAEKLYNKILEYITSCQENETTILDLFCGTGTIGQLIATQTKSNIIGVDIIKESITNATENSKINKLKNICFLNSDVKDFLKTHKHIAQEVSIIIIDPPRSGMSKKSMNYIIEFDPQKIIYISCNPSTQARDFLYLSEREFKLEKISLIDQFPHTAHIETVSILSKK